mgnify:CR=1 FL=1
MQAKLRMRLGCGGAAWRPLAPPFVVLATQNPLDQEGTYPLPEAELDRFLFKILIDYPELEDETRMVEMVLDGKLGVEEARTRLMSMPLGQELS